MNETRHYTISDAARLLGKPNNRKLIRRLMRAKGIKTQTIGQSVVIDQEGFDVLAAAVREWDGLHEQISQLAASA